VPPTTFEALLQTRATEVARRLLDQVAHTMSLEAQTPDPEFHSRRVQELAEELVRTLSRELWKEEA
jgi:hypothetical protein